MKDFILTIVFILAVIFLTYTFTRLAYYPKVDLPEEHMLISRDSLKPDNLTGWYDSENVLHLQFKN